MKKFNRWSMVSRWYRAHYNPHSNILLKRVKITKRSPAKDYELSTGFGSGDDVEVFRLSAKQFGVLSINDRLPYVGWTVFQIYDRARTVEKDLQSDESFAVYEPYQEIFLQEDSVEEVLGPNWERLAPGSIARILDNYIY